MNYLRVCVCVFRCVYSAAVWYHDHLAGMMDVVMITEDQDTVARYGCLNAGVYVITVQVRNSACLHLDTHGPIASLLSDKNMQPKNVRSEVGVPRFTPGINRCVSASDRTSPPGSECR